MSCPCPVFTDCVFADRLFIETSVRGSWRLCPGQATFQRPLPARSEATFHSKRITALYLLEQQFKTYIFCQATAFLFYF